MNAQLKDSIDRTIKNQTIVDDALRDIFKKHFEITEEKKNENPGYIAWASYAVEVAVAMSNIIISLNHPEQHRGFRAVSDLTFALNANEFWVKNAPVLVPVLTIILNSHRDYIDMAMQRKDMGEYAVYDKLMGSARIVALEIFPMILYLVGGPMLMSLASLELKKNLAPYFLG